MGASWKPPALLLDPAACFSLLGTQVGSLDVSLMMFQLHSFLKADHGLPEEIASIPRRLLEHNEDTRRRRHLAEMLPVDADVVFEYDGATKSTNIDYKAYFASPGFERIPRERRVVLHIVLSEGGLQRSISVPLQALMPGFGDVNDGHQGYTHSITFLDTDGSPIEQWYYVGVTSRNWLERMDEHMREVRAGSNKRFHSAWRSYAGNSRVMLGSELIVLNHSFAGIMGWEEEIVDRYMLAKMSLNMIPGGFKGNRFLYEHGLAKTKRISLADRDRAIAEYARTQKVNPRVPNVFLARLWESDEFYLKVLAGRSDVLTPAQVVEIRDLHVRGVPDDEIAVAVQARNVEQVRRVIAGKTYSRVA